MSFVFFGTIYLVLVKISTSTSTQSTYMYKHKHKYLCLPYGYNMYFLNFLILLRPGMVNLNVFSDKTKTKLFKSKAAGPAGSVYEYFDK